MVPAQPQQQMPMYATNGQMQFGAPRGAPQPQNEQRFTSSGRLIFPDDHKRLPRKYKFLGGVHLVEDGINRCAPKRMRASLISSCDHKLYPQVRVGMLDEEHTDLFNFAVLGLRPDLLLKYLMAPGQTLGSVRDDVRDLYGHLVARNASRMSALSEQWDNIPNLALRHGYPRELLSPRLYQALECYEGARDLSLARTQTALLPGGSPPSSSRGPHAPANSASGVPGTASAAQLLALANKAEQPQSDRALPQTDDRFQTPPRGANPSLEDEQRSAAQLARRQRLEATHIYIYIYIYIYMCLCTNLCMHIYKFMCR